MGTINKYNATTINSVNYVQNLDGWDKLFIVVFSYIGVVGFGIAISGSASIGIILGLFPLLLFWNFGLVNTGFLAVATIFSVIGGFYTRSS
jgi:hypothetical protein